MSIDKRGKDCGSAFVSITLILHVRSANWDNILFTALKALLLPTKYLNLRHINVFELSGYPAYIFPLVVFSRAANMLYNGCIYAFYAIRGRVWIRAMEPELKFQASALAAASGI